MTEIKKAILRTLAYADIFDYPLKAPEVWRYLIGKEKSTLKTIQKTLLLMSADLKLLSTDNIYYCLGGRQNIIYHRERRKIFSQEKLKIAKRVAQWLKLVPWIKMVGVTGSLALLNSDKDDDIDILIVSARERLWLTRLFTTILVELLGCRRHPENSKVKQFNLLTKNRSCDILSTKRKKEFKDKICLNMFLDEDHLAVPQNEQDLFSAHEVCQMRPLWDRDGTYLKFLRENLWVKDYLANGLEIKNRNGKIKNTKKNGNIVFSFLEKLLKHLQLWYMAKRRTTEVISEGIIRFHPKDVRNWVLREYKKRLNRLRNIGSTSFK